MIVHSRRWSPAQATLVPDARDVFTSDQGWPLTELNERELGKLRQAIVQLKEIGTRVSLFVDPSPEVMPIARELAADRVELYTFSYAAAFGSPGAQEAELARFASAADAATRAGLEVNSGHDLNLSNLAEFLRHVRPVQEVSIGHALIADALELGMTRSVERYSAICKSAET